MSFSDQTRQVFKPFKKFLKYMLPDLAEAYTGIRDELRRDQILKAKVKRNFIKSIVLDVAEAALWLLPGKFMPKSFLKQLPSDLATLFLTIPRQVVGLWGGFVDASLFRTLADINRRRIKGEVGSSPSDKESQSLIAAGLETFKDIRAGLRADTGLRARFWGLAAIELVSDVADARMGLSRNMPGLAASLLVSQVIGLKELDWTAKAFRRGVEIRQKKTLEGKIADVPLLRLMALVGMEEKALALSRVIAADTELEKRVNRSSTRYKIGTSTAIGSGMLYATRVLGGSATVIDATASVCSAILGLVWAVAELGETRSLLERNYRSQQKSMRNFGHN